MSQTHTIGRTLHLFWVFTVALLSSCYTGKDQTLQTGDWRGLLTVQGKELPFNFQVSKSGPKSYQIQLINGDERIVTNEIRIRSDSMFATMHIFDTELRVLLSDKTMNGVWVKNYEDNYVIPFRAEHGAKYRFQVKKKTSQSISGNWQVTFLNDTVPGLGIFEQDQTRVVGTFLTGSGDYRYLEGSVNGDSLFLSAFDGEHAFLFNAKITDNRLMQGEFRSGSHYFERWTAEKNEAGEPVNQDSITYLNPGYHNIEFSFPDLNGRTVSLSDSTFSNRVVILQLFGSWCPNCMDETKFLSQWYNANRELPVEIIGLAYERLDDFSYAKRRLEKMAARYDVQYQLLVAGTSDKEQASQTLPMLNQVSAFPTTIFINHQGLVRKIHTGFMGPGTGQYYQDFIEEFETLVDSLVAEKEADTLGLPANTLDAKSLVP